MTRPSNTSSNSLLLSSRLSVSGLLALCLLGPTPMARAQENAPPAPLAVPSSTKARTPTDPASPAEAPPPTNPPTKTSDKIPDEAPPALTPTPPPTVAPPPAKLDRQKKKDDALLAALISLEEALLDNSDQASAHVSFAMQRLAALGDARAVPRFLALSSVKETHVRLSALTALTAFTNDGRARERLLQTLGSKAPAADAAVALPGVLAIARADPNAPLPPCPEDAQCAEPAQVLAAFVAWNEHRDAAHLKALGALKDARSVAVLLRASTSGQAPLRTTGLNALGLQTHDPRARARLFAVLSKGPTDQQLLILPALFADSDAEVTEALLKARRDATDNAALRQALQKGLEKRAPVRLAALVAEEERLALLEASKPKLFDYGTRGLIAATAGLGAAYGGAAASSFVADQVLPQANSGLYGAYGCCVGLGSAAAVGWFALGDSTLGIQDAGLALSGAAWGAWAGFLVPPTIGTSAMQDSRHQIYAAATGHVLGLAAFTTAALYLHPDTSDLLEIQMTLAAANLGVAGALLSIPADGDPRILPGALIGATLLGAGGSLVVSHFVDLSLREAAHVVPSTFAGFAVGLQAGIAIASTRNNFNGGSVLGTSLLGGGLGLASTLVLDPLGAVPDLGGSIYEGWAAIDGAGLGLGAGFLANYALSQSNSGFANDSTLPFALGAGGMLAGALTTAAFPGGVEQDLGDLLLHPLLVGFTLYHAAALSATLKLDGNLTGAASLLIPSAVAATLVHTSPFFDATAADTLMVASMMTWGLSTSLMALGAISERTSNGLQSWVWVAGTASAIDVGILAGVALSSLSRLGLSPKHLGWKVTYVSSVAAATTLVLALPGSLIAPLTNGVVTIPDALLASTATGLAIGVGTMLLIDFDIAPDLHLDKHIPLHLPAQLEITPTVTPLPSLDGKTAPPVVVGMAGRF